MAAGRFVCVALPLVLILASIIATLVAVLSGVTHHSLDLFSLDLSNLTIPDDVISSIAQSIGEDVGGDVGGDIGSDIGDLINSKRAGISASTLGLSDTYKINLWGYCYDDQDGKQQCTDAKFDWASGALNTSFIEEFGSAAGVQIDIPDDITNAIKTFRTVTKWTEVAFIIALVALGVEFVVGIFSNFTRIVSCLTWLIGCVAALITCASAALATVTSTIVVGVIEGTGKEYGVQGDVGTNFLAAVWIGAAFALAAALFWVFTICCCKPEHRSRRDKHRSTDGEKLLEGGAGGYSPGGQSSRGYAPLDHEHEMTGGGAAGSYYNPTQPQFDPGYDSHHSTARYPGGTGRSDLAYEPYSHRY